MKSGGSGLGTGGWGALLRRCCGNCGEIRAALPCPCITTTIARIAASAPQRRPGFRAPQFVRSRPQSPAPSPVSQSGFTLLEVLLALVLMAMTMVGVWGALRTGAQLTRSAEASTERSDRVRAVQAFLRNYLGGAQPQAFVPAKDQSARMFIGDPLSLTYVAPMPAQLGNGGLFVQRLQFVRESGGNDYTLQLIYAPLSGDTASPASKPETLLEHVTDAGFEYLVAAQGNAPAKWQRTWHSTNGLPLAVHIVADPDWGGRVGFPEMLVPLRAGNGSGVPISLGAGQ